MSKKKHPLTKTKEPYQRKTWLNPLDALHIGCEEEETLFLRKLDDFIRELRGGTKRVFPDNTEVYQIAKITLRELGLLREDNG